MTAEQPTSSLQDDAVRLPGWGRVVLGLGVAWHLFAIVVAPLSMPPPTPASPVLRDISRWATSYYTFPLHLHHGYRFFAPDPPPFSTLLEFEVSSADLPTGDDRRDRPGLEYLDDHTARVTIPSRDIWPRLLYHRHFMLCEQFAGVPEPIRETRWARALARTALETTGAKHGDVVARLLLHRYPSMEMVRNGVALDAPESYEESGSQEYRFPEPDDG